MDQGYKELMERPKVYMNKEEGVVQELRGEKALVLTDRHTMCGQCVAKGYCHMLGGGKEMLSEARNPIGAQPGDMVVVGIPEGSLTRASLVIYMVPAIGLVGGATLGHRACRRAIRSANPAAGRTRTAPSHTRWPPVTGWRR